MDEADIENALKARLGSNLTGLPSSVAWPNQDHDGVRPFLEVLFSGGQRTGGALKGASQIETAVGVMAINVHVAQNTSSATANGYADAVKALFAEGYSMSITGGKVVVTKPADIRKGFRGDAGWIVPVIVTYRAHSA